MSVWAQTNLQIQGLNFIDRAATLSKANFKAMNGYIFLWKKVDEWEWYKDVPTFKLFIHLLINANYKDENWRNIEVKRGQLISSIEHLAAGCGLTTKQTRRAISNLISTGEIVTKGTNKFTIITICNYDNYQAEKVEAGQTKVQTKGQSKVQSKGTQIKNIRIKENNNTNDSIIYSREKEILTADESATKTIELKSIEERAKDFMQLVADSGLEKYGAEMCRDFFDYWTEHNPNGKKMRFEMQKIFDVKKRLATWNKNNFKKQNYERNDFNNPTSPDYVSTERIIAAGRAMAEAGM